MHIEEWPLDRIRPYPNNPRVLRNAAEKVAESIREFGWRQPIVVDDEGVVIIGHGRLAAAKLLKLATAPVHVATGLPAGKVRALRIADNKTGEFSAWDDQKLVDELAVILDGLGSVAVTGFTKSEFAALEMQARAALAEILPNAAGTSTAPAPAATENEAHAIPAASAVLADPADSPVEVGAGQQVASPGPVAQDPAPPHVPAPELVPFNVLMTADDRQAVYDAVNRAKSQAGARDTAAALAIIARSYQ
jgi:ParB-like chromosome segregation protein Spo0J